jgi:hypothetical protein
MLEEFDVTPGELAEALEGLVVALAEHGLLVPCP